MVKGANHTEMLGDQNESEPPDPIPNSEVKPLGADDSVAVLPYESRLCQALKSKTRLQKCNRVFHA